MSDRVRDRRRKGGGKGRRRGEELSTQRLFSPRQDGCDSLRHSPHSTPIPLNSPCLNPRAAAPTLPLRLICALLPLHRRIAPGSTANPPEIDRGEMKEREQRTRSRVERVVMGEGGAWQPSRGLHFSSDDSGAGGDGDPGTAPPRPSSDNVEIKIATFGETSWRLFGKGHRRVGRRGGCT